MFKPRSYKFNQFQIHERRLSGSDVDRMGSWAESRRNGFAPKDGLDRPERPVELATSSKPSLDVSQVNNIRVDGYLRYSSI